MVWLVRLKDNIRGNIRHRIGDKTTNSKRKSPIDVGIQHSELSHSNVVVNLMSVHIQICTTLPREDYIPVINTHVYNMLN